MPRILLTFVLASVSELVCTTSGAVLAAPAMTAATDNVFANGFEAGHAVVLGHDFDSAAAVLAGGGALRPDVIDTGAEKILGNAVFLTPASASSRPINVLLVNPLAGASSTAIADVKQIVCSRVMARFADAGRPRSCKCFLNANACVSYQNVVVNAGDPVATLADALAGNDVAMILNDRDGTAASDTVGAAIASTLSSFVIGGGVVIGLGGDTAGNTPSNSFRLLSGLIDIVPADAAPDPSNTIAVRDCASDDPLTYDAAGNFLDHFLEPPASVRFAAADARATEVYASPHSANCASGCSDWKSMVVHKTFPDVDQPKGPVTIRSFTDGQPTDASVCASDTSDKHCPWAAFFDANGALIASCPLRGDGTAHRDTSAGTIAVVTSVSSSASGERDQVRAAYGLQPYDNVTLGQARHPVTGPIPVNATVDAGPFGSTVYFLTTGCNDSQVSFDIPDTTAVLSALSADSSCLHFDESDNPLLNVLVTARDVTERVVAYAYVADVPLTSSPGAHFDVAVGFGDWKTSIGTISPAQVGAIPPNTTVYSFGLLAGTGARPLYEEHQALDAFAGKFRLTAPNGALTTFAGITWHQHMQFASGSLSYSPFVIQEMYQPPLGTGWTVDNATFLGHIGGLIAGASAPPRLRWLGAGDAQQQLISTAHIGMWLFDAATPLACANSGQASGHVQWLVTFPAHGAQGAIGCDGSGPCLQFDASGNSGDIQIPTLPAAPPFACFQPLSAPQTYAFGFHRDPLLGDAGLRRDAENNVRPRISQPCGSPFEDEAESQNNFPQDAPAPPAKTNTSIVVACAQ